MRTLRIVALAFGLAAATALALWLWLSWALGDILIEGLHR
jgi:hypothetical protein